MATFAGNFSASSKAMFLGAIFPPLAFLGNFNSVVPASAPPPGIVPVSQVSQGLSSIDGLFGSPGDLGVDVATFPELSDSFQLISGRRAIAENVYRRLTTGRGQMAFHPDAGKDLRQYLNDAMTDARIFAIVADVEAEAKRDERVYDATATGTYSLATSTLLIQLQLVSSAGPFSLVLGVTAAAVTLNSDGA
ncbi:MAG: hypothetical protein ABI461_11100 [Polyangiaceae bacterium]